MSVSKTSGQMNLFSEETTRPPACTAPSEILEVSCTKCQETFLSDIEVAKRYGVSRASVWRWVKNDPKAPKPIKLSPGTTRWKLSELIQFEEQSPRWRQTHK